MSKIMTFCLSLTVTRIVLNSLFVQLQSLKLQVKIYCERQCANSEKKKKKKSMPKESAENGKVS